MASKEEKENLITKTESAKLLDVPIKNFDRLGLIPVKQYESSYYRGTIVKLYAKQEVEELINSPLLTTLRPVRREPKNWDPIFERKYSFSPQNAMTDAIKALLGLEYYIDNTPSCRLETKGTIRDLSREFIIFLYKQGYCVNFHKRQMKLLAIQNHREYDTVLVDLDEWYYGEGRVTAQRILVNTFIFKIGGKFYSRKFYGKTPWFDEKAFEKQSEVIEKFESPSLIKKSKLSELKALINWVMRRTLG